MLYFVMRVLFLNEMLQKF